MIRNYHTTITDYIFNKKTFSELKESTFGDKWPVVYIIEDKGKRLAYIGETTNICNRINQHWNNPKRKKLKSIHIIHNPAFNKSVILDLEAFLIKYIASDGKYQLQNGNGGQHFHHYYQREEYQKEFKYIWQILKKHNIVTQDIRIIENSDLFKYSPYKTLTEEQYKITYQIIERLKTDLSNGIPRISIIDGGAGTGKSILGIFLLKLLVDAQNETNWAIEENNLEEDLNLIANGLNYNLKMGYVVPMQNFRKTLKKVFKGIKGLSPNMVLSPADVANSQDKYDILIIDESHRLRQRYGLASPGDYKAFDHKNEILGLGKKGTELDWILKKSKYQFFFYDSGQSIKPTDVDPERFFLLLQNKQNYKYKLTSQLRCKGGNDYIQYIQNILNCKQKLKITFKEYDLKLYEDVDDMISEIKKKNKEVGLCRNIAGYAWDWKTKGKSLSSIIKENLFDIEINGYKYIWNRTDTDWINSPNSINEIGCIHTTQGFDLNYAGIILGPEIDYDNEKNRIFIYKKRYKDNKGKMGIENDSILLAYIKNIYTTILERGLEGTYIYVCNDSLRNYLKQFFPVIKHNTEKLLFTEKVKTIEICEDIIPEDQFSEYLPLYTIQAACGYFGEGDEVNKLGWIKVSNLGKLDKNMFVVQAKGNSMEPTIHDGDYCVFRANPVGSRQGKIVLTQHINFYDGDNVGNYSIKTYTSLKKYSETGEWEHEKIVLEPKNKDYKSISIDNVDCNEFKVIGEFIGIIKP